MPPGFPSLEFETLLRRIAAAPTSLTVLTPNHRLAQALVRETDARQLAAGASAWEAPDILHWSAWLQRCHEEASFSGAADGVPGLAGDEEAQLLWEDAVRASRWSAELPSTPAFASLAAEAWTLAHAWGLENALATFPGNEDIEAFHAWRSHYEARTGRENLTDSARLPAQVAAWLESGALARPATLVLHAFDLVTPQQANLFGRCAALGIEVLACAPRRVEATVRRLELESPRRELEIAARWARSRLERAAAEGRGPVRVAVIVPRLAERRAEAGRIFARAFATGAGGEGGGYVNLSAGDALAARPLVDAALAIIDLALGPLDYDRASRLLRSPFLGEAESERLARARLDAALRRIAPARVSLRRLRSFLGEAYARRGAPQVPQFAKRVDALLAVAAETGRATPQAWARRFSSFLDAMGWPGDRALDSAEYQTLEKLREMLRIVAALGTVAATWEAGEARARLARLAAQTLFQPASGEVPVQVLGILEVGSSRVDLQACKLEYSIVSPK